MLCRVLGWRQPNGWLKDRACRDALRRLHELGLIVLPPRQTTTGRDNTAHRIRSGRSTFIPVDHAQGDLKLVWAKGNKAEQTWNDLVQRHHYLGHKVIVGRCIKYLVKRSGEIVAAISFSSAAWNMEERTLILSELGIPPWDTRDLVINNSRFLLLSQKGSVNIASRILAMTYCWKWRSAAFYLVWIRVAPAYRKKVPSGIK